MYAMENAATYLMKIRNKLKIVIFGKKVQKHFFRWLRTGKYDNISRDFILFIYDLLIADVKKTSKLSQNSRNYI